MPLETYITDDVLSLVTGQITIIRGTGKCYLGLLDENRSEPSGGNYSRICLNVNEAMKYTNVWKAVENGMVSNTKEIYSPECTAEGGWPTFVYFGIYDAETGGNLLAYDYLTDPDGTPDEDGRYPAKTLTVAQNNVAVFRTNTLRLKLI